MIEKPNWSATALIGHDGWMFPIMLERSFRIWSYGVGHSQLVLLSRAQAGDDDDLVVHFEAVRAMELLSLYRPLILDVADESRRSELIAWAGIPPRLHDRFLYLSVSPRTPRGYVVCGRMNLFAVAPGGTQHPRAFMRPPGARVLYSVRPSDLAATEQPNVSAFDEGDDLARGRRRPWPLVPNAQRRQTE